MNREKAAEQSAAPTSREIAALIADLKKNIVTREANVRLGIQSAAGSAVKDRSSDVNEDRRLIEEEHRIDLERRKLPEMQSQLRAALRREILSEATEVKRPLPELERAVSEAWPKIAEAAGHIAGARAELLPERHRDLYRDQGKHLVRGQTLGPITPVGLRGQHWKEFLGGHGDPLAVALGRIFEAAYEAGRKAHAGIGQAVLDVKSKLSELVDVDGNPLTAVIERRALKLMGEAEAGSPLLLDVGGRQVSVPADAPEPEVEVGDEQG